MLSKKSAGTEAPKFRHMQLDVHAESKYGIRAGHVTC
jgi:hypothetical protein